VRVSHYGFGWCVFAVALFVFFWLAPLIAHESPAASRAPATAVVPRWRAELGGVVLAVVILIALPLLNAVARGSRAAPPLAQSAPLLDPHLPWRVVPVDVRSAWLPIFPGADELQRRAFGNGAGETVEVLWVAYRTQRQGAELVGETSSLTGNGLKARAERVVGSTAGQFRETEVTDRTGDRSLIWSRYQIDGRNLVRPLTQQLWYGVKALIWQPSAGLIALRTPCDADCGSARRTLQDFVAHTGMR
jgi:EpsI family protein